MTKRSRRRHPNPTAAAALPLMLAQTYVASLVTIARRCQLIATGRCTPAEGARMVSEKAAAARETAAVAMGAKGAVSAKALLAPWHRRVKANARRLGG